MPPDCFIRIWSFINKKVVVLRKPEKNVILINLAKMLVLLQLLTQRHTMRKVKKELRFDAK